MLRHGKHVDTNESVSFPIDGGTRTLKNRSSIHLYCQKENLPAGWLTRIVQSFHAQPFFYFCQENEENCLLTNLLCNEIVMLATSRCFHILSCESQDQCVAHCSLFKGLFGLGIANLLLGF